MNADDEQGRRACVSAVAAWRQWSASPSPVAEVQWRDAAERVRVLASDTDDAAMSVRRWWRAIGPSGHWSEGPEGWGARFADVFGEEYAR